MTKARAFGRWNRLAQAEPDTVRELMFAVKQKNMDQIHEMLMERSDPQSSAYGQWLSADEVRELTRNDEALEAVKKALRQAGAEIVKITKSGGMVRARASLRVWEGLLETTFHTYASSRYNTSHVAAEIYSIPGHLHEQLTGILGVTDFPMPSKLQVSTAKPWLQGKLASSNAGQLTPEMIRAAYNMPDVAAADSDEAKDRQKVTQAVFASNNLHWSPSDRAQFQEIYALPERNVTELDSGASHASDAACQANANNCAEPNLDVQYMLAMSPWSEMGLWYTDDSFTSFLSTLSDVEEPPDVISISYGTVELANSQEQIDVFDSLAAQLGVQGVTLIAASGDDGAAGSSNMFKDGNPQCSDTEFIGYLVNWPAGSQYVTAVGATAGIESGEPETTCQISCANADASSTKSCNVVQGPLITSGGGISHFTATPKWQASMNPCDKRGIPDVSLAGHSYNVIIGGESIAVDGTSASAPAFGGMVSLVNARRKAAGKSTVGFINTAIYQNPSAFNDITTGDNKCSGMSSYDKTTQTIPCCGGYDAQEGWDPATGLGSVNFPKFEAIFGSTSALTV